MTCANFLSAPKKVDLQDIKKVFEDDQFALNFFWILPDSLKFRNRHHTNQGYPENFGQIDQNQPCSNGGTQIKQEFDDENDWTMAELNYGIFGYWQFKVRPRCGLVLGLVWLS